MSRPPAGTKPPTKTAFEKTLKDRGVKVARALEISTLSDLMHLTEPTKSKTDGTDNQRIIDMLWAITVWARLLGITRWKMIYMIMSDGMVSWFRRNEPLLRARVEKQRRIADYNEAVIDAEELMSTANHIENQKYVQDTFEKLMAEKR